MFLFSGCSKVLLGESFVLLWELCFDRVLFSFESEVVTEVTEPVFKSVFKSDFEVDFVEL